MPETLRGTIERTYHSSPGFSAGVLRTDDGLTAHKAQGSEFTCAVVVCHRSHFFADRNWLYTAVTRAARYCVLLGDRWGLRSAVRKNSVVHRRTFLDLWARKASDGIGNPGERAYA